MERFLHKIKRFIFDDHRTKIGIIGLSHSQNVGNNLLKYAMFIKLSELGYSPYLIGKQCDNHNISFLLNSTKVRLIKSFSDIKENEFNILMVNSDQTWNALFPRPILYDIAFLKFAENWKIKKFIYGASLVFKDWKFSAKDEEIAKHLLQNFTGISVRESNSVGLIEEHLGLKAQFVLDPTFIINKKYYFNLIKDYKSNIEKQINNTNFVFVYILNNFNIIKKYLEFVEKKSSLKIFYLNMFHNNQVLEFLYGIIHGKAVITDSFHGTVFSIIFKKPFISFLKESNDNRINNLAEIFNVSDRIFFLNANPPISLLDQPLFINETKLMLLTRESIKYIKKNLNS